MAGVKTPLEEMAGVKTPDVKGKEMSWEFSWRQALQKAALSQYSADQ